MLTNLIVALVVAFLGPQAAAPQAPVPPTHGTTPAACLTEVRDWAALKNRETGITGASITDRTLMAQAQRINQTRTAMARQCAAQFNVMTTADQDLASLIELYTEGDVLDQGKVAVERALPLRTQLPVDRAATLSAAMTIIRRTEPAPENRDARLQNMYPRLEQVVAELDGSPAASVDQKFEAHRAMLGSYRGDDIDTGIIKHATWIIEASKTFSPVQRQKQSFALIVAYIDMAEAWAGQGMTDQALELLRTGKTAVADLPRSAESIDPEIARLELVGTAAHPVAAPRWLNAPEGTTALPMTGSVTLLEFTAHWCGPCRESYPGINRLRARFASQGLRVVLATQFWGYFSRGGKTERSLTPEVELERDRAYFAGYDLDVPVAIGDQVHIKVADGKVQYEPAQDQNDTNYQVGGIPQIQIIDKKGIIRRMIVGYDNANEDKLAKLIADLLKEK